MKYLIFLVLALYSISGYTFQFEGISSGSTVEAVSGYFSSKGDALVQVGDVRDGISNYTIRRKSSDGSIATLMFCRSELIGAGYTYGAVSPYVFLTHVEKVQSNANTNVLLVRSNREMKDVINSYLIFDSQSERYVLVYTLEKGKNLGGLGENWVIENGCGVTLSPEKR